MVKYCDGFTCKKKKRRRTRYQFVQNGTAAPQNKRIKVPAWKREGFSSLIDWKNQTLEGRAMTRKANWEGLEAAAYKYIAPYKSAKDLYTGFRDRDAWKIFNNIGGQAYDTLTTVFPEFTIGSLAAKGLGAASTAFKAANVLRSGISKAKFMNSLLPYIKLPNVASKASGGAVRRIGGGLSRRILHAFTPQEIIERTGMKSRGKAPKVSGKEGLFEPWDKVYQPGPDIYSSSYRTHYTPFSPETKAPPRKSKSIAELLADANPSNWGVSPSILEFQEWQPTHDKYGNSLFKGKDPQ